LIFVWSSLPKIQHPYDFLVAVYRYELARPSMVTMIAVTLPLIELVLGLALLGGICIGGALLACVVLGALFTFAQIAALYRGLSISCGCFGTSASDEIVSYATVLRSVSLAMVSLIGLIALLSTQRAVGHEST
jgi:hypothetical protein